MKEEGSSRYLSSSVKQDLAKLNRDGDSRGIAIKSLKLLVEQLDSSSLPRFISQIAESWEAEGTRSYAISLYEDVARVHGKLVVPHISKMMGYLVRSTSSSGSFPKLQLACGRVTTALARHCIDSDTFQEDAEKIMQEICAPLIDALAGKLEPVAATAATCIHALVETEQWKYAHDEIVHEICQRTTVALSEKSIRTAAHMHLACVLASTNPDTLSVYGASLLRAGEDILKVTVNSWQLRKASAKLLQSVLTILDKETLETQLGSALHVLDSCRLDKMTHVRAAVSEALHTAKMLASGSATFKLLGTAASPIRKATKRNDRSPWSSDEFRGTSPRASMNARADSPSPVPKRGTSPRAPVIPIRAGTNSSRVGSPNLRAASPTSQQSRGLSYSPASSSASESVLVTSAQSNKRSKAKRAPVYPSWYAHSPRSIGTPGTSPSSSTTTVEECKSPSRRLIIAKESGRTRSTKVHGNYSEEDEARYAEKNLQPRAFLTSGAFTGILPTELDLSSVEAQKRKENPDSNNVGTDVLLDGFENARQARLSLPRLKLGGMTSQTGLTIDGGAIPGRENGCDAPTVDMVLEKREIFTSDILICAQSSPVAGVVVKNGKSKGGDRFTHRQSHPQAHRHNAFTHLGVNLEEEKRESLTTAKDLLPFIPPTRFVRSLSNLSNPEFSRGSLVKQDMKLSQDDVVRSMIADAFEVDAETSREAGWSVRDNPMASEESYPSDNSDEDMEHRSKGSDFPRLRKVGSIDSSPREIHMVVPEPKSSRSFDDPSGRTRKPEMANDMVHPCGDGLPNLIHKDEMIRDTVCSTHGCQYCDVAEESDHSCAKDVQHECDQGLRRFSPVRIVAKHWRTLRWCAEAALGGSLFLVLAVPVAMIFGKALNSSQEFEGLVPT